MHLLIILAFIPLIKGQVANLGKCPEVQPVQDFRKNDFAGRWYEIQRYSNMFDKHFKCIYGDYSFPEDGKFHQSYHFVKSSDNSTMDLNVVGSFKKGDNIAAFEYDVMEGSGDVHFPLNVIATDYVNYLVYWGCEQRSHYSYSTSWIFSRNRTLSPELLNEALKVYEKNGLDTDTFTKLDQTNCPN